MKIAGTIGYYAFFKDTFIENFCKNKDKPELQCDGKCVLSKMLLQESNEKEAPINLDFLKNETQLYLDVVSDVKLVTYKVTYSFDTHYINHYRFALIKPVLQPPRV